jgi:hypothetical protein
MHDFQLSKVGHYSYRCHFLFEQKIGMGDFQNGLVVKVLGVQKGDEE